MKSAFASSRRIPELDGLRGVAIGSVFFWHYVAVTAHAPHHSLLSLSLVSLKLAWSGVDLFFVLSGFLIGGILLDARGSRSYFVPFYARRFFRIVPLYAVVCGLYAIACHVDASRWTGPSRTFFLGDHPPLWAFPFFLQNFFVALRGTFDPLPINVTWSLCVEEQFYLTLPLLVRFLPKRRLLPVLVSLVVVAAAARSVAFYTVPTGGTFAYAMMPLRADSLLLGVVAALLVRDPRALRQFVERRGALVAGAVVLGLGLVGFVLRGWTTHRDAAMCTVGYTWIALFYTVVLLLAVMAPSGRLGRVLRTGWLRRLGGIAYGTYLLHVAVQGLFFGVLRGEQPRIDGLADLGVSVLAAATTIAVAYTSWVVFEKRMVRIGHRFRYDA